MKKTPSRILAILALGFVLSFCIVPMVLYRMRFWDAYEREIHCWVKAVNQNGKGVKGYKCEVVYSKGSQWPFGRPNEIVKVYETGNDGCFEFLTKGWTEFVWFGNGCDRQWSLNPKHLSDGRLGLRTSYSEMRQSQFNNPVRWQGSRMNPYLLHVFSLGPPQPLLYSKYTIKLETPEDYFCIDVLKGKTWESKKPEGHIAMADYLIEKQDKYLPDIPMHIPAIHFIGDPNCEMAPVRDAWGLEPPINGYSRELNWPEIWQEKPVNTNWLKIYYRVKSGRDGKWLYGIVKFDGNIKVDSSVVELFTNLQGQRNLYFKGYEGSMRTTYPAPIKDYVTPPVE